MKKYGVDELRLLAGREFNAVLAADEELKRLDGLKYDKAAETRVLLEVLGVSRYYIGSLPVCALTAARWAFLWLLGSPFVIGGTVDQASLDTALYILSVQDLHKLPCAVEELPAAASGYAAATGLSPEEICSGVRAMIDTAFLPLRMLPPVVSPDDDASRFDGMWVSRIAGLAAQESGISFDDCLHVMSLSCACCLYVNRLRRESCKPQEIRRRPTAEVEEMIERRMEELEEQFLAEKKIRAGGTERSAL